MKKTSRSANLLHRLHQERHERFEPAATLVCITAARLSSLWLHMGSFGPKRVVTVNAGVTPPAPYKLEDNPDSLLDKADLVFIDPVGTGFSKAVGKAQDKFLGRGHRCAFASEFYPVLRQSKQPLNSPKFLLGESYGTFRNAALASVLQNRYGIPERPGDDFIRLGFGHDFVLSRRRSFLHSLPTQLRGDSVVPQAGNRSPGKFDFFPRGSPIFCKRRVCRRVVEGECASERREVRRGKENGALHRT